MTSPEFDEVARQIAAVLNADPSRINSKTTAADVDRWDSVRHANIILTLEDTYGITFTDDEVLEIPDVGTLYDCLVRHCILRA